MTKHLGHKTAELISLTRLSNFNSKKDNLYYSGSWYFYVGQKTKSNYYSCRFDWMFFDFTDWLNRNHDGQGLGGSRRLSRVVASFEYWLPSILLDSVLCFPSYRSEAYTIARSKVGINLVINWFQIKERASWMGAKSSQPWCMESRLGNWKFFGWNFTKFNFITILLLYYFELPESS